MRLTPRHGLEVSRWAPASLCALLVACAHAAPPPPAPPPPVVAPPPREEPAPVDESAAEARASKAFDALASRHALQLALSFDTPKNLKNAMALKTRGLQTLEKDLLAITRLGSRSWAFVALVHVGMLYDNFAQTLRSAAVPSGLDDGQAAMFRSELEGRAAPHDTRAVEIYARALQSDGALSAPDDWVQYAKRRLGALGHPVP